MYAKIFEQIFDSSIAEDRQTRWIFMDLLILSRPDGIIDMTHEAISRRTNVPIEIVRQAIVELEKPDAQSRSGAKNGARLVRLDKHRDWGWKVVNYAIYRKIASEIERREVDRKRTKQARDNKRLRDENVLVQVRTNPDSSPSPSSSVLVPGDRGAGEGGNPSLEDCMASVPILLREQIAGNEDFAAMVFNTWNGRDGKDGAGVKVRFAKHLEKRWNEEGEQWRNKCHSYQLKQKKSKGGARKIPTDQYGNLILEKSDKPF